VVRGKAVELRDGLTKVDAGSVGVEVGEIEGIANGLKGSRGGAERIFVGSEFCDLGWVESVFAGDIGDGPTRLVGVEVGDVGVGLGAHGF